MKRLGLLAATSIVLFSPAISSAQRSTTGLVATKLGAEGVLAISGQGSGGHVSAMVELPMSIDAASFGLHPITPGIAVLDGDAASIAGFALAHPTWPMEIAPPLTPKLDLGVPFSAAEQGRLTDGTGRLLDGTGVYVGIVDTGIDVFHEDFRNADKTTRIAWLLDLAQKPDPGSELDKKYGGRVFTRAMIDAILAGGAPTSNTPDDLEGHGTHVAGIAAGNGGELRKYVGMAPKADLVIVRATRAGSYGIQEADAILGAKFVFDMAAADHRPAAVNLSLGSQFGPHDGTSSFEQGLARLAIGKGRAVVVAASNEGATPIHTSVRVSSGTRVELPIRMGGSDGNGHPYVAAGVYIWLNFRDGGEFRVGVDGPGGPTWLPQVARGDALQVNTQGVLAQISNDVSDATIIPRGTHGAVVVLRGALPVGDYRIILEGDGAVEAWIEGTGDAGDGPGTAYFPRGGQVEGTIGIPASSDGVISVGCVGVRQKIVTRLLKTILPDVPVAAGERCFFSSAGPSAAGSLRPDVLAPGYFVVSSLGATAAKQIPNGDFTKDSIVDPTHASLSGTSMSTPFGTGAIALMMQKFPELTQEEARFALMAGSRPLTDDNHGGARDYAKGAGILDVEGAIAAIERAKDSPRATSLQLRTGATYLAGDGHEPFTVLAIARAEDGRPADVTSLEVVVDGAVVRTPLTHLATGLYRVILGPPEKGLSTHATVSFAGGGLSASRDITIAADKWDARHTPTAAGGCAWIGSSGSGSGSSFAGAGIFSLAALLVARRRVAQSGSKIANS